MLEMRNYLHQILALIVLATSSGNAFAADHPDCADGNSLVILGASYAGSWNVQSIGNCAVVNAGVDGNQSFEMSERFARDVASRAPEKVLVWGFINDIFRSDPSKIDEAKERIKSSYVSMIGAARDADIDVILATEVTMSDLAGFMNWIASTAGRLLGKTSYQDMINGHVQDVNTWLRSFARSEGIPLLDFERALAGDNGKRKSEFAVEDGSHLTTDAYSALNKFTEDTLQLAVK